jgi:hypothetical protein
MPRLEGYSVDIVLIIVDHGPPELTTVRDRILPSTTRERFIHLGHGLDGDRLKLKAAPCPAAAPAATA